MRIPEPRPELPPASAFWSATLYDAKQGFFIPNKETTYSVGQHAGMKLDASRGCFGEADERVG